MYKSGVQQRRLGRRYTFGNYKQITGVQSLETESDQRGVSVDGEEVLCAWRSNRKRAGKRG